jgi:uroporphyrinogen decarboxylase
MPFGTPAEVASEVKRVKEILGRNGGLLIAPTHILEPDVPWENVLAFVKAAKECLYE